MALAALAALVLVIGLGTAAAAPATAAVDPTSAERDFFALLNTERTAAGLAPLVHDPSIVPIAREWSEQMSSTATLSHRPDLRAQIEGRVTTQWQRIGENVGRGGDVAGLHQAFMNSPGHKANVVGDYNRLGVGVVVNGSTIWVTFNFLKGPAVAPPPPTPTHTVPVTTAARPINDSCPDGRVPEDGFGDVAASSAHEAAIDCVVWWQIALGTSARTFAPASPVTRGQMASFLVRLVQRTGGSLPAPGVPRFRDAVGSVHADNIELLAAAGIAAGRPDGTFGPNETLTRAQILTFIDRTHGYRAGRALPPATRDHCSDDAGSPHEAATNRAAQAGILEVVGGSCAPNTNVDRQNMGSHLARELDLLVEQRVTKTP